MTVEAPAFRGPHTPAWICWVVSGADVAASNVVIPRSVSKCLFLTGIPGNPDFGLLGWIRHEQRRGICSAAVAVSKRCVLKPRGLASAGKTFVTTVEAPTFPGSPASAGFAVAGVDLCRGARLSSLAKRDIAPSNLSS